MFDGFLSDKVHRAIGTAQGTMSKDRKDLFRRPINFSWKVTDQPTLMVPMALPTLVHTLAGTLGPARSPTLIPEYRFLKVIARRLPFWPASLMIQVLDLRVARSNAGIRSPAPIRFTSVLAMVTSLDRTIDRPLVERCSASWSSRINALCQAVSSMSAAAAIRVISYGIANSRQPSRAKMSMYLAAERSGEGKRLLPTLSSIPSRVW